MWICYSFRKKFSLQLVNWKRKHERDRLGKEDKFVERVVSFFTLKELERNDAFWNTILPIRRIF